MAIQPTPLDRQVARMTSPHPVETTLVAKILSSNETAAERLGLSLRTLERLAKSGDGPPRIRLSARRIGYREADVAAWLESR
jgi:predicted DNA-binding transcriptional regulator AlpA